MFFKYLGLLAKLKDVSIIYKEETGADKPWYVSRRFFGTVMVFIAAVVYSIFNVTITGDTITILADNVTTIGTLAEKLIPAIVALYGAITGIVGLAKKSKSGGTMKSIIAMLIVLLAVLSFVPVSHAQEIPAISWPGINFGGDTAYLFTHNTFAVGTSMDLINIKDGIATVRPTALFPAGAEHNASSTIAGVSAVLNLKKALDKAGAKWIADTLNPSIGGFGGYDFGSNKFAAGAILTVLKVTF